MTLSIALFNAVSGLRLNQTALDVTAQNVANVNTEGYSRKIIQQEAKVLGGLGAGVELTRIVRNVDEFLLKDMRIAAGQVNDTRVQDHFYGRMQDLFGSLQSDSSVSAFIADLATRFQALANAPEEVTLQTELASRADLLAQHINKLASELQDLRAEADRKIADAITEVSAHLTQVNDLNIKIAEHLALELPATALQDQRDTAINKIAEQMGVKYFGRNTGEVVLMSESGRLIVDRTLPTLTHTASSTFTPTLVYDGTGAPIDGIDLNGVDITTEINTGRIGGLLQLRDTILPDLASQIEELAGTLQKELNGLHNQGTAFPGLPSITGTRSFVGTDRPVWTGNLRVAVLDTNGLVVESQDVNLAAMANVAALNTQISTMANVAATLNAAGQVNLQISPANPAYRLAINEMTSTVTVGDETTGASAFLGLNDLFSNAVDHDVYRSDHQTTSTTALGLAGTLTFRTGAFNRTVNYVAGDTLATLAAKIDAALVADNIDASVLADGSGFRLHIASNSSGTTNNFFVTDSSATGIVNSLNVTRRDAGFASTMALRSDIKSDPSRVVRGALRSATPLAVGSVGVSKGDNSVAQSISNRFTADLSFAAVGQLAASQRSLANYAAQIIGLNSTQASNVQSTLTGHEFVIEGLRNSVTSISGVNLDEEMANMIILENAYAASARVIETTSQLFDVLSDLLR